MWHVSHEQLPEFDRRTQNRASVFVQVEMNNRINRSTRVLESRFTTGLCLAVTFVCVPVSNRGKRAMQDEGISLIYEQLTRVRSVASRDPPGLNRDSSNC